MRAPGLFLSIAISAVWPAATSSARATFPGTNARIASPTTPPVTLTSSLWTPMAGESLNVTGDPPHDARRIRERVARPELRAHPGHGAGGGWGDRPPGCSTSSTSTRTPTTRSAGEWNFEPAALQGSSYLKLPRALAWAVGNANDHHVHHLSAGIPNYHLRAAHEQKPMFAHTPVFTSAQQHRRAAPEAVGRGTRLPRGLPGSPRAPRCRDRAGGGTAQTRAEQRIFDGLDEPLARDGSPTERRRPDGEV